MKAIIIKINNEIVAVTQISEVTPKKYLELQRKAKQTINEKDEKIAYLENELSKANSDIEELTKKINYLGKQIAIDRGEIEEDDTNEYELVLKEPQPKEEIEGVPETEPLVSEEEDIYFEEKEESEEHE